MFWDIYVRLCNEVGEAPNVVAAKNGVKSSGTVTGWKNGAIPRESALTRLADYFGVTVEYLLTGEGQKEKLTIQGEGELDKDTIELTEIWNTSDADERTALLEMARFIRKKRG